MILQIYTGLVAIFTCFVEANGPSSK